MKDVNIGSPVVVTDMSNLKDKSDNNNIEKNVLYKTENAKDIKGTMRDKDKSDDNNIEKTVLSYETDNAKDTIKGKVRDKDMNSDISKEPAFEIRYGTVYL